MRLTDDSRTNNWIGRCKTGCYGKCRDKVICWEQSLDNSWVGRVVNTWYTRIHARLLRIQTGDYDPAERHGRHDHDQQPFGVVCKIGLWKFYPDSK